MEGACHSKADGRKRAYMIATYRLSEAGDIEVELPEMAPCGADGQACCIRKHSARVRKMGINHPLVVVRCGPCPQARHLNTQQWLGRAAVERRATR